MGTWKGLVQALLEHLGSHAVHLGVPTAPQEEPARQTYEAFVLEDLEAHGAVTLEELIGDVAESAMRADALSGAMDVDGACAGRTVYRLQAATTIQRMIGRSLVLECEGPWVLASPFIPGGQVVPTADHVPPQPGKLTAP